MRFSLADCTRILADFPFDDDIRELHPNGRRRGNFGRGWRDALEDHRYPRTKQLTWQNLGNRLGDIHRDVTDDAHPNSDRPIARLPTPHRSRGQSGNPLARSAVRRPHRTGAVSPYSAPAPRRRTI